MNPIWIKNLKEQEDIDKFSRSYNTSETVRERLSSLIEERIQEISDKEINLSVYDSPSWENKQAHINGMKDFAKYVSRLIKT